MCKQCTGPDVPKGLGIETAADGSHSAQSALEMLRSFGPWEGGVESGRKGGVCFVPRTNVKSPACFHHFYSSGVNHVLRFRTCQCSLKLPSREAATFDSWCSKSSSSEDINLCSKFSTSGMQNGVGCRWNLGPYKHCDSCESLLQRSFGKRKTETWNHPFWGEADGSKCTQE